MNHDGKPDLVSTSQADDVIQVLINAGDGSFLPPKHYYALNARGVTIGDFNGDGNADLAVLSPRGNDSRIDVYFGNGDGTFATPAEKLSISLGISFIANADMNGDGLPDLLVTTVKNIAVFINQGGGNFAKAVIYKGGTGLSGQLVVGDFNRDGVPDIADVRRSSDNIAVMLGQTDSAGHATGALGLAERFKVGNGPKGLAVGDFNGDGKLDLAVANSNFRKPALAVLQGNGDGTFAQKQPYFGGSFVDGVIAGDFNGDGNADLATVSFTSDLRAYAGNGDGTFAPFRDFPSGHFGQYVVSGDFNGDGKDDIAIAAGAEVKVLIAGVGAVPPTPAPSDFSITLGGGVPQSISYQDASGSPATVSLVGVGIGVVTFSGDNLSIDYARHRIIGGPATVTSITLTGTDTHSTLSIKPQGRNARVNVGTITSYGIMGNILAPHANLVGNLTAGGPVSRVMLDTVRDGTISLNATGQAVDLSLGNVNDESLISAQPIHSLTVGQWYSATNGAEQISAPSVDTLRVLGQFSPDLTLGAGGLGAFSARGILSGLWNVAGPVGSVQIERDGQFTLNAASIGSVSAGNVLNTVTLNTTGDIGSIFAGSVLNCSFYAGVALPAGQRLPASLSDFVSSAMIHSVQLMQCPKVDSFLNTAIAAQNLGRLNLGRIGFANGGKVQGIAAVTLARLSGVDTLTRMGFSLTDPTSLQPLIARGINPQDFVLNVFARVIAL